MTLSLQEALLEALAAELVDEDFKNIPSAFNFYEWEKKYSNRQLVLTLGKEEYNFYFTSGASKGVLVPIECEFDYVLKIPFPDETTSNPCEKEVEVFDAAVRHESEIINDLFAPCGHIGDIGNAQFYWMEYFDVDEGKNEDAAISYYIDNYESFEFEDGSYEFRDEAVDSFYSYYGEGSGTFEYLESILFSEKDQVIIERFLTHYAINDLHAANFYYDEFFKRIIIIDYSGY